MQAWVGYSWPACEWPQSLCPGWYEYQATPYQKRGEALGELLWCTKQRVNYSLCHLHKLWG